MTYRELIDLLKTANTPEELQKRREDIASLIPEVRPMFDFDHKNGYHMYDIWLHSLYVVTYLPKDIDDDMLYLGALLHDIGKPAAAAYSGKPGDDELHYKGHQILGLEIVKNKVMPELLKVTDIPEEDRSRLFYYVEHHDDSVSATVHSIRKHYRLVDLDTFKKLMLLEIADSKAHVMKPLIVERLEKCNALYDGLAEKIYSEIKNEKC